MTSPFKRLEPFSERDAAFFFGRESESRLIASDLFASAFSVLYGESGVGKSSLLRAGVLPLLRAKHDVLPVLVSEWQENPLAIIKKEVADEARAMIASRSPDGAADRSGVALAALDKLAANATSTPLDQYLRAWAKALERRLLLILDQFEEVFLYHSHDNALFDQLPNLVVPGTVAIRVMISLREDAVAKLDVFEDAIPQLFSNYRRVEHLHFQSAASAISGPITHYNELNPEHPMAIEAGFINAVLSDVPAAGTVIGGEGERLSKPAATDGRIDTSHLQLVISRLWDEEVARDSTVLRIDTFRVLGGADKIIKTHIDEVMGKYSPELQQIACSALRYLVTPSGAKVAYSASDLAEYASVPEANVKALLLALCEGERRVLRTVGSHPRWEDTRYEVYHDRQALAILDWVTRFRRVREKLATAAVLHRRATWLIVVGLVGAVVLWLGVVEPTLSRYASQSATVSSNDRRKAGIEKHITRLEARRAKLLEDRDNLKTAVDKNVAGSGTADLHKKQADIDRELSHTRTELMKMEARLSSSTTARARVNAVIVRMIGFQGTDPGRFVAMALGLTSLTVLAVTTVIVFSRRWVGALFQSHGGETAANTALRETKDVLGRRYGDGGGKTLARMAVWILVAVQARLLMLAWQQSSASPMAPSVLLHTALLSVAVACAVVYHRSQLNCMAQPEPAK